MVLQLVVMIAWFAAIAILVLAGLDFLVIAVVVVAVAFGMSWIVDPRRSWWGPGPAQVMADPAARRRYRVVMTVALIAGLVVLCACVTAVIGTGLVPPAALVGGTPS